MGDKALESQAGVDGLVRFEGVVEQGLARGRQLGFPTANLRWVPGLCPGLEPGVYVGRVGWEGGSEYGALINVGKRPTFGPGEMGVEIHLLDFSGNLYGKFLTVRMLQRLRDEQRFARVELLVEQLHRDLERARAVLLQRDT